MGFVSRPSFIAMNSKNDGEFDPNYAMSNPQSRVFSKKKVTCSPLRWTFLHLKTILGMIAHKINLKMTHAGIFFILLFFPVFAMRDDDDGISS